jgi:MFS family permease
MLGFPLAVFAGLFALEWRRSSDRPPRVRRHPLVVLMSLSVLGSAGVHGAVVAEHFAESAVLGWFFVLLGLAQVGFAVALLVAPWRSLVVAGVLGHLGVVALWAWTRAVGVPLGVDGGARERVGALDLTATALEVLTVLCGLALLVLSSEPRRAQTVRTVSPSSA